MSLPVIAIHIVVSIALILIVLLQTGKGADMGAAFGGGASQTLFGTTGASTFLSKATTVAAVIFMLTSLTLAYMSGNRGTTSRLVTQPPAQTAPIPQPGQSTQPANPEAKPEAGAPAAQTQSQNQDATPQQTTPQQQEAPNPGSPATNANQ